MYKTVNKQLKVPRLKTEKSNLRQRQICKVNVCASKMHITAPHKYT